MLVPIWKRGVKSGTEWLEWLESTRPEKVNRDYFSTPLERTMSVWVGDEGAGKGLQGASSASYEICPLTQSPCLHREALQTISCVLFISKDRAKVTRLDWKGFVMVRQLRRTEHGSESLASFS